MFEKDRTKPNDHFAATFGTLVKIELDRQDQNTENTRILPLKGRVIGRKNGPKGDMFIVKLTNGYNIMIEKSGIRSWEVLDDPLTGSVMQPEERTEQEQTPFSFIGTGGTIASMVDYRTGAVHPARYPTELRRQIGKVLGLSTFKFRSLSSVLSEDITPSDWCDIGKAVVDEFDDGSKGVIITHGTDTLAWTSCALSFLLGRVPGPVVLVGAQRSSDRPSSDSHMNLRHATTVAGSGKINEVCVVMHGGLSDDISLVHRGTWIRKMHSTRRDAFRSINGPPIGMVHHDMLKINVDLELNPRSESARINGGFDDRVLMVHAQPGLDSEILHILSKKCDILIIAGTGMGHIRSDLIQKIREIVSSGKPVVMTTTCIDGMVDMNVYSTGKDLLDAGAIPAWGLHPDAALIKSMFILHRLKTGNGLEIGQFKKEFLTDICGETVIRSNPFHYMMGDRSYGYQGD